MRSEGGFLTLDFLFAMTISVGMTILVFGLTFTLATVEVAQYIAFSTSRAAMAGDVDPSAQEAAANRKYDLLVKNQVFAPLFANFFELSKKPEIKQGYGDNFANDYKFANESGSDADKIFTGVRIDFISKILNFRIPLLGSVAPDDGYKAKITAFLLREPTQQECIDFMRQRIVEMKTGDGIGKTDTVPWEDNGC